MIRHWFHLSVLFALSIIMTAHTIAEQNKWETMSGPNGGDFRSVVCCHDKIYAGACGVYFTSDDYGQSWKRTALGGYTYLDYMTVNDGGVVTAGSLGSMLVGDTLFTIDNSLHRICRSTDLGKHNRIVNDYYGEGKFIAIDDSGAIYVVSNDGIEKLKNYGRHESESFYWGNIGYSHINSLVINPNHSFYLGVDNCFKKSTDYGATWTARTLPVTEIKSLCVTERYGILAGTTDGIYRSTDSGATWTSIGLSGHTVNSCAVDSKGNLYAATWVGLFKCSDINQADWRMQAASNTTVFVIAQDERGTVYAATRQGLRFSNDRGQTWKFVKQGYYEMYALAIDHKDHLIFGSVGLGRYTLPLTEETEVDTFVQSHVGGAIWGTTDLAVTADNKIHSANYGTMMISEDDGMTWTVNTPFNSDYEFAYGLTVTDKNEVYVALGGGGVRLYGGRYRYWLEKANGIVLPDVYCVLGDSLGRLYCGNWNGLWYSDDKGSNWHMRENDRLSGLYVKKLAKNSRGEIFAGTPNGLFMTRDRGESWKELGLNDDGSRSGPINIQSMVLLSDDTLLVGGYDDVLYRCVIGASSTAVAHAVENIPEDYALSQNYPNPFNGSTEISYALREASHVTLTVFDVLGKKITELVNSTQPEGHQHVRWNADLASGMYFYRLEAIGQSDPHHRFTDVKKKILMR